MRDQPDADAHASSCFNPCLLLQLVLHNAKLLLMQLPRFCFYLRLSSFPSGAAVCAQHMEFSGLDPKPKSPMAVLDSLGASYWLILRSLSLPGALLGSLVASLTLSKPIFLDFF